MVREAALEIVSDARAERALEKARPGEPFQFERKGYYVVDSKDSCEGRLVFNRTVSLRDSWAKMVKAGTA